MSGYFIPRIPLFKPFLHLNLISLSLHPYSQNCISLSSPAHRLLSLHTCNLLSQVTSLLLDSLSVCLSLSVLQMHQCECVLMCLCSFSCYSVCSVSWEGFTSPPAACATRLNSPKETRDAGPWVPPLPTNVLSLYFLPTDANQNQASDMKRKSHWPLVHTGSSPLLVDITGVHQWEPALRWVTSQVSTNGSRPAAVMDWFI